MVLLLAGLLTYTLIKKKKESIVMTSGDLQIDNVMFNYFLWSYVNQYHGESSEGPKPDQSLTLDVQMYDENLTWEEYLRGRIVEVIEEKMSLYLAAEAEGFTMPEEYQSAYEESFDHFKQIAKDMKYDKFDDYLVDMFGEGSNEKSFKQYLYYDFMSDAYATALYERSVPTEDQILSYYESRLSDYELTGMEAAATDLHQDEYYNLIAKAKAEHPFTVMEEHIVVSNPEGVGVQSEENLEGHEGHQH